MGKEYQRLETCMNQKGITKKQLAELLGLRYATVIDKIKGRSRFTCEEAIAIKRQFFSEHTIEDLFEKEQK